MRVGLPSFKELTDQIYAELRETFQNDAREEEGYDRTLRALEKLLRRPGNLMSPVRIAGAKRVSAPAGWLSRPCSCPQPVARSRSPGRSRVLIGRHDLAEVMQSATPDQKLSPWQKNIPQDVDMWSGALPFKHLQILRATGNAFLDAVDTLLPFIMSEDEEHGTRAYHLRRPMTLCSSSGAGQDAESGCLSGRERTKGTVFDLKKVLDRIATVDPPLVHSRKFQSLLRIAQ